MSPNDLENKHFDFIIIGSGPSGSLLAKNLAQAGLDCLLLEAGESYLHRAYPQKKIYANAKLYWSGGAELDNRANLGFLRPKVVGGGSIVNQALLDRFDDDALDSWRSVSGVDFFSTNSLEPYYEKALQSVCTQKIPEAYWNGNAEIFAQGLDSVGHRYAPLVRAQKDCQYEQGNDCIECLSGCPIDSKQSMAITTIPQAIKAGLKLESNFEVTRVAEKKDYVEIRGRNRFGDSVKLKSSRVILGAGAIGNSKLLLASNWKNPWLGKGFFCHPQFMTLAIYDKKINAHKGPFQALKSQDPIFRKENFKLENVFASPMELAMLFPGIGQKHQKYMKKINYMACIEVAIRDQSPGQIIYKSADKLVIRKSLNAVDRRSRDRGIGLVHKIFHNTGAKEIIDGGFGFGLHLMGGCAMGVEASRSVVAPDFSLHGSHRLFCADSSIFPNAPGINPSLTIMALSIKAAQSILRAAS